MTSETDAAFLDRLEATPRYNPSYRTLDSDRLFDLARRGAEAAARIEQLEAALRLRATAEDECRNAVDHVGRYNSGDRINEAKGWVRNAFAKFEEAERAALGEERT